MRPTVCGCTCHRRCCAEVPSSCALKALPANADAAFSEAGASSSPAGAAVVPRVRAHRFDVVSVVTPTFCAHCGLMLPIGKKKTHRCKGTDGAMQRAGRSLGVRLCARAQCGGALASHAWGLGVGLAPSALSVGVPCPWGVSECGIACHPRCEQFLPELCSKEDGGAGDGASGDRPEKERRTARGLVANLFGARSRSSSTALLETLSPTSVRRAEAMVLSVSADDLASSRHASGGLSAGAMAPVSTSPTPLGALVAGSGSSSMTMPVLTSAQSSPMLFSAITASPAKMRHQPSRVRDCLDACRHVNCATRYATG